MVLGTFGLQPVHRHRGQAQTSPMERGPRAQDLSSMHLLYKQCHCLRFHSRPVPSQLLTLAKDRPSGLKAMLSTLFAW